MAPAVLWRLPTHKAALQIMVCWLKAVHMKSADVPHIRFDRALLAVQQCGDQARNDQLQTLYF